MSTTTSTVVPGNTAAAADASRRDNFTIGDWLCTATISLAGLIQAFVEELRLALFRTQAGDDLFLDRVFDILDEKHNGVIEFEEFVHVLSVFHPRAPVYEKINFAFRLYDKLTGFIERDEVRKMVIATLLESGIHLSDEALESNIENTFADADVDKDGRISTDEWIAFVLKHPSLTPLQNCVFPDLDISAHFQVSSSTQKLNTELHSKRMIAFATTANSWLMRGALLFELRSHTWPD